MSTRKTCFCAGLLNNILRQLWTGNVQTNIVHTPQQSPPPQKKTIFGPGLSLYNEEYCYQDFKTNKKQFRQCAVSSFFPKKMLTIQYWYQWFEKYYWQLSVPDVMSTSLPNGDDYFARIFSESIFRYCLAYWHHSFGSGSAIGRVHL